MERKIPGIEAGNKKNAELNTSLLANVLNDFKISGDITNVRQGPIVTLFELTPHQALCPPVLYVCLMI